MALIGRMFLGVLKSSVLMLGPEVVYYQRFRLLVLVCNFRILPFWEVF